MSSLEDRAARYRPAISEELRRAVGAGDLPLFRWMRYHLGWEDAAGSAIDASPGKLLRPVGLLLACDLCGGDPRQALPAAAAIELVHNFSLLHDDVEDSSERRRGRPTLWTFAGAAQAINTGDALYTLARLTLHGLLERGVEAGMALAVFRDLDEACLRLVEGQYHDMAFEGRVDVTREAYVAMSRGKSAVMFATPFAIGARLAGADAGTVEAFRRYGCHVGLAFQATDDVLGIWGDAEVTGKPVGDDLRGRKLTYPVIAALEQGGDEAERLRTLYTTPGGADEDVTELTRLVERLRGRPTTEAFAEAQRAAALESVAGAGFEGDALRLLEAYSLAAAARVS